MKNIAKEEISATEARELLVTLWGNCEFGVKERVKRYHAPRTIHYILTTPSYSRTKKILEIIDCIKEQVSSVKNEVLEMDRIINLE